MALAIARARQVCRLMAVNASLRTRLLLLFVSLFLVVGTGTLVTIERTLSGDLLTSLDARLTAQGRAVAAWLEGAGHPERLAPRLSQVTRARLTIIAKDGLIEGDSRDPALTGRPVGDAPEVAHARRGEVGRATRRLGAGKALSYLVAVPTDEGRVVRLAVPLADVQATRKRMRNRLLAGSAIGFVGALLLSFFFIRAVVRPLQSMTRSAERLAQGDYDVRAPVDAGGELGVLARAFAHLGNEVKARVGQLTEQRDLLSTVISGLIEGVMVIDQQGQAVLVNDAARPLVGADIPEALQPLVASAQGGHAADAELELRGRAVRASARPLPQGALIVLYDVTQLRALEAVRREFLSNAAHELRTPITAISGYAETLLAAPIEDPETTREFLEIIHRNANRIAHLVSDLLVLDGLEARASVIAERTSVALAKVVQDAAANVRAFAPQAEVTIDIAEDLAVLGTRDGLDHVVQNLLDNAVKYGGSPVVVAARRLLVAGKERVQLTVTDRGPGIPQDQQVRIFERFYRLDTGRSRDRGGSGLGLAIVQSQVRAMGGEVWVESQPGQGARFCVELDAAAPLASPEA